MLEKWIYDGELDDPYLEFFISKNNSDHNIDAWNSHSFLSDKVPSFITMDVAKKAFLVGKSLFFIRNHCFDEFNLLRKNVDQFDIFNFSSKVINEAYQTSCKHLMTLLFQKFSLNSHLDALKKFMLLGQGDFVQTLIELLG